MPYRWPVRRPRPSAAFRTTVHENPLAANRCSCSRSRHKHAKTMPNYTNVVTRVSILYSASFSAHTPIDYVRLRLTLKTTKTEICTSHAISAHNAACTEISITVITRACVHVKSRDGLSLPAPFFFFRPSSLLTLLVFYVYSMYTV